MNGDASKSSVLTKNRLAPYEGRVAPLGDEPVGDIILFVAEGLVKSRNQESIPNLGIPFPAIAALSVSVGRRIYR